MNNFKIIYRILKHLEESMDYEYINTEPISPETLGISKPRWEHIMIMLIQNGYITGVNYIQTLGDEKPRIVEPVKPIITLRGIEYLSENTFMKKASDVLKGIKEMTPGL